MIFVELPEQPDRRRHRGRLLRPAGRLRPCQRHRRRARQRLRGHHLRRLRGAELSGHAGSHGGRRGDVQPLQELQHDRLACRRHGRQPRGRRRLLAPQDQPRLRHVRGRAARRRRRAQWSAGVRARDVPHLRAPPRSAGRGAANGRHARRSAQGHHLPVGAGARRLYVRELHAAGAGAGRRRRHAGGRLRSVRRRLRPPLAHPARRTSRRGGRAYRGAGTRLSSTGALSRRREVPCGDCRQVVDTGATEDQAAHGGVRRACPAATARRARTSSWARSRSSCAPRTWTGSRT